jgi:hypothetical protein
MKKILLLAVALLFSAINLCAQIKITKIKHKDKEHCIANVIGYPITGVYTYGEQLEPSTVLNEDGSGSMQNEDLVKEDIIWGIECTESGVPIFKEGFNSNSYSFWYKKSDVTKSNSSENTDWIVQSFSIHFDKLKMFISGERAKVFQE